MKTKILILSLISFFIFSCSSDDENSGTPPIPADQKFLSKITNDEGATVISLEYNSDKTIKKKVSESFQVRYEYDTNGWVSKSYVSFPEVPTIITDFEHDANGNIVSYTQNDEEYVVEKVGNKYLFLNDNDAYEIEVNNNEITKLVTGETQIDFFLVDGKSGALSNTNNLSIYDCISNPFYYYYFNATYNLNHRPLEEILGGLGPITYQNEFDEDGFLKRSVVNLNVGDGPQTVYMNYEYVQL